MSNEKTKAGNFALRMPDQLREDVRLSASLNNRSMNAEILHLIEKGLKPTPALDLSTIHDAELLSEVRRRFNTTISVNVELSGAQLAGVQRYHERRDADGNLIQEDDVDLNND